MTGHTSVRLAGYACAAIGVVLPSIPSRALAAGEVRVYLTVNGVEGAAQPHNAGDPINIDVTPIGNNVVTMIRINAEVPSLDGLGQLFDVGPITITGTRGIGERLRVLIAGFEDGTGTEYVTFPDLNSASIPAGARHWAGIVSGNSTTQLTLREFTNLAASITGNLDEVGTSTGSTIDVGKVVRLQVRYAEPSTEGGNIRLPVSAWFNRTYDDGGAIGYIVASNSISGDIECKYDASSTGTPASIDRVLVGPGANAAGISGRILAPYGRIRQIRSSGPIEIESSPESPGILAGKVELGVFEDGIDFIMAGVPVSGDPDTPDPAYPRDIDAVIVCHSPTSQSLLQHLRTAGDLKRPVFADALGWPSWTDEPTETRGIFVGGTVYEPITIKDSVYLASIVAETYAPGADITIGNLLKGRIEAVTDIGTPSQPDLQPGYVRTVSVGHSPPPPLCPTCNPADAYPGNGMNGWSINENDPESVVRAKEIERFDASRVFLNSKHLAPAILADAIGEIDIGTMQHGVIAGWTLDPTDGPPPRAELGDVRIGTITYANGGGGLNYDHVTVWAATFDSFEIENDNAGYLHFSQIPTDRALIIGNGMRGPFDGASTGWSDGRIFIDDAAQAPGLHGCIVLNANDGDAYADSTTIGEYCNGEIRVGRGGSLPTAVFSAISSQPERMPLYDLTSETLGGGGIALTRTRLQDEDCSPPNPAVCADAPRLLLQTEFSAVAENIPVVGVTMRFYGPVRVDSANNDAFQLDQIIFDANNMPFVYTIPAGKYTTTLMRGEDPGFGREVHLRGIDGWWFSAGLYRFTRREPTGNAPYLFCDGVAGSPPVKEFTYCFYLLPDCNEDGVPDTEECTTPCDCAADFNQDGGVDGADVEAFFIVWEAGQSGADTNCDGGVDGRDVETFFVAWEAGGCD